MKVADTIANYVAAVGAGGKEAINASQESSLAEGMRFERRIFHSLFATRRSEGRHESLRREAEAGVEE